MRNSNGGVVARDSLIGTIFHHILYFLVCLFTAFQKLLSVLYFEIISLLELCICSKFNFITLLKFTVRMKCNYY